MCKMSNRSARNLTHSVDYQISSCVTHSTVWSPVFTFLDPGGQERHWHTLSWSVPLHIMFLVVCTLLLLLRVLYRLMVSGHGIPPPRTVSELKSRKMSDKGIQYELPIEMLELRENPQINDHTVAEINTTVCETTTLPAISNHRPRSTESLQLDTDKRRTLCEDIDEICVQPVSSSQVKLDEDKVDSTYVKKEDSNVQEKPEETSCGIECLYFTMQCCECTIL